MALRLELAAGCRKIAAGKDVDVCGVYYPDPADPGDVNHKDTLFLWPRAHGR